MSVTDVNSVREFPINSRNTTPPGGGHGDTIGTRNDSLDAMTDEQLGSRLEALTRMLVGNVSPERREQRRRASEATKHARACGKCGEDVPQDAVVYLAGLGLGRSWQRWLTPICESCAPPYMKGEGRYYDPRIDRCEKYPCHTCARPVVWKATGRDLHRQHVFCCGRCRWTYYNDLRNERNARAREKVCEVCDEAFTATRQDAKVCSPACKQKAYRLRRKALDTS
jgi:hypothetical protein